MATLCSTCREVLLFCDQAYSSEITEKGEGHLSNKLDYPRQSTRWQIESDGPHIPLREDIFHSSGPYPLNIKQDLITIMSC